MKKVTVSQDRLSRTHLSNPYTTQGAPAYKKREEPTICPNGIIIKDLGNGYVIRTTKGNK